MSPVTTIPKVLLILGCASCAGCASAADLEAGRAKAEVACQVCHGMDGQATQPMVAHISGQQKEYLVAQLEAYRDGSRRHAQMNIIAGALSDADITNLAQWYSHIEVSVTIPE